MRFTLHTTQNDLQQQQQQHVTRVRRENSKILIKLNYIETSE